MPEYVVIVNYGPRNAERVPLTPYGSALLIEANNGKCTGIDCAECFLQKSTGCGVPYEQLATDRAIRRWMHKTATEYIAFYRLEHRLQFIVRSYDKES